VETDESTQNLESTINAVTLKPLHWRIWILSSMGIFIEGFNLFAIAVALPLIIHQYKPTPLLEGFIAASVIVGTVFGAAVMGRLADIWGRRRFYISNALIVTVFSLLAGLSTDLYALIVFQFFLGVGIGADYPICASYVSEFMPSRIRGRMLIGAFSFQAVGMFSAAFVGFIVLNIYPNVNAWPWMMALGSVPAGVIFILRMTVPESPRWCIENGRKDNAIHTISQLSRKSKKAIIKIVNKEEKKLKKLRKNLLPFSSLFKGEFLRRTILSSVPWFLMDIATYGVGIFTPTIITSVISGKGNSFIAEDILSIEGAAIIDMFLFTGLLINILLVEKLGRIKLQLLGFIGMTIGLLTLAAATCLPKTGYSYMYLLLIGFIIYNFLMNMGPNATTFILPAELFPTKLRATAHGFSAAFAKVGAVCGILFLPLVMNKVGLFITMVLMSAIAFLGFVLTFVFKVETKGKSLEELSHLEAGRTMEHYRPKS
jgi:MFS transporter, putative metabolite transport protein